MTAAFVLGTSILLQVVSAILAFRLIRISGWRLAWTLIAVALTLMALCAVATMFLYATGGLTPPLGLAAALAALVISGLMLAGLWLIGTLFQATRGRGQALSESEQRFRKLVDGSLEGILIHRGDENLFMNDRFAEIFGYTPEEFSRLESTETIIAPEDRARLAEIGAARLRGEPAPTHYEFRGLCKDGSVIWLENHVSEIEWDGKVAAMGAMLDVTAHKQAEEELRESRERLAESERFLQTVVDTIPAGIAVRDIDGRFIMLNDFVARLYGEAPEDLLDRPTGDTAIGYSDYARHLDERVIREGKPVPFHETRILVDDEARTWWETKVPLKDDAGEVKHVLTVAFDITDRKRTEDALVKSQHFLETVIDTIPALVAVKDEELRYVTVNKALADWEGLRPEDIIGRSRSELGLPQAEEFEAEDGEVFDSGRAISYHEVPENDRQMVWLETRVPIAINGGSPKFVLSLALDITARKQAEQALRDSEERYRYLYNNTPALLHSIDRELRVISVSDYWLSVMGYERDEVIGRKITDFMTGETRDQVIREIEDFIKSGIAWEAPRQYVKKNGEVMDTLLYAMAEWDEDGEFTRSVTVLVDVTERKRMEEELAQAQKMEAIGQLAGGIAHDFNNLLTVISGNLQLLVDNLSGDETLRHYAVTARNASRRGAELTDRLLTFSRGQPLRPEITDLNKLVDGMADILVPTLGETVDVEIRTEPALWSTMADQLQLENALLNLAINARNAMPDGGRLTVETANIEIDPASDKPTTLGPGRYVALSVTDSGTGMSHEVRDRAFEPFFTTKEPGQGTGLGLSTIHGFATQSRGDVAIETELGKGTTVTIYLPQESDPVLEAAVPLLETAEIHGNDTVLVVEDDDEVRELSVNLLNGLGYRTLEAVDGEQALALLDDDPGVGLIFTDVVLPGGMDGPQLVTAARRRRPELKALFTSGYAEALLTNRIAEYGTAALLSKPFGMHSLARKVREVLNEAA